MPVPKIVFFDDKGCCIGVSSPPLSYHTTHVVHLKPYDKVIGKTLEQLRTEILPQDDSEHEFDL